VTTEQVAGYRLMQWPQPRRTYQMPYFLVGSSPLWDAMEGDSGVREPVWQRRPVTYARTLYGEYGGLPGAPRVVLATAVERGLELAAGWDSPALVVTNLTPHAARHWRQARRPDAEVTLYWAHRARLGPGGVAEFVADLEFHKARRELRRQWKRGNEAGLRLRILHGAQILPLAEQITEQARSTSGRHGPVLYGPEMVRAVSTVPGALALVADHPEGMAGAFLAFHDRQTLYLWTAALDGARRRLLHTYPWLMYQSVIYATTHGATILDCGRGNYAYKGGLGLETTALTSLVYLAPTAEDGLAERLAAMDRGLHAHAHAAWSRNRSGQAPAPIRNAAGQ
jgi:hypothetical protein